MSIQLRDYSGQIQNVPANKAIDMWQKSIGSDEEIWKLSFEDSAKLWHRFRSYVYGSSPMIDEGIQEKFNKTYEKNTRIFYDSPLNFDLETFSNAKARAKLAFENGLETEINENSALEIENARNVMTIDELDVFIKTECD